MNPFVKKLIRLNNLSQTEIISPEDRSSDWRYQIMELPENELINELETWPRAKLINWLEWNDSNGIWTDEDSLAEGFPRLREIRRRYSL